MSAVSLFALKVAHLRALIIGAWSLLLGASPVPKDAPVIADAIAATVASEASPVWSYEQDAAVGAVFVFYESGINLHPLPWVDPKTGKAVDDLASGAFQLRSWAGHADARTQAVAWYELLRDGAKRCPASPAAPLSGSCSGARRLADRRVSLARRLVDQIQARDAVAAADQDAGVN